MTTNPTPPRDDAPDRIWAFEDYPGQGAVPRSGYWIDVQSECPKGSPEYIRADLIRASLATPAPTDNTALVGALTLLRGQYTLFVGPDDAIAKTVLAQVDAALASREGPLAAPSLKPDEQTLGAASQVSPDVSTNNTALVEKAARLVEDRISALADERGIYDPSTGATEFRDDLDEWLSGELQEIAQEIRALASRESPPAAQDDAERVAEAARQSRQVFSDCGSSAKEALDYMEQLLLAALRALGRSDVNEKESEEPLPAAQDALDRMRRANERGTGCRLTAEMVRQLGLSIIGQMWMEDRT